MISAIYRLLIGLDRVRRQKRRSLSCALKIQIEPAHFSYQSVGRIFGATLLHFTNNAASEDGFASHDPHLRRPMPEILMLIGSAIADTVNNTHSGLRASYRGG
jgi:hypothetical protein